MRKLFFILFLFQCFFSYSNYNPDSSKIIISAWKFFEFPDSIISVDVDTALENYYAFPKYLKNNPFYSNIGNIGRGGISKDLDYIDFYNDFFPINQYHEDMFSIENCIYYNTKKQYSNINYNKGAKKEGSISIFHTQNISSNFNFGIKYLVNASNGNYKRQTTKTGQFSFFSSYNGLRYNSYFNLVYNKFTISENGGIASDSIFEDNILKPAFINVKLNYAVNKFKNFGLFYSHEFKFGRKIITQIIDSTANDSTNIRSIKSINHKASIEHTIEYNNYYKLYTDRQNGSFYNSSYQYFYDLENDSVAQILENKSPYFINSTNTYDSTYYNNIQNTFLLKLFDNKIFKTGARIYFRNSLKKNYIYDYDTAYSTNSIGINLFKLRNKKFKWSFGLEYYINGYNKSNFKVNTREQLNFNINSGLEFIASLKRLNPSFLENNYMSNHFRWDSTFLSKDETKYQIGFYNSKANIALGFKGYVFDNFIYFDEIGYPRQNTSTFNVYSLYFKKRLKFKNIVSIINVIYQKNDNEYVLRIPEIMAFNSNYYQFSLFKKVLKLQIGFDINYNSKYYVYSYVPATGVFNIQNEREIGNYPLINVFINFHLKRARFYIKLDHVNSRLMSSDYYYFLHYPAYGRTLKFGISWNFYD
ncbi:MAG: hypothetical protein A2033_00795 [Bacteroidetes bacterium GWA2_31_9]|nr:MAG: hypothetical protein A2033_00795 [Bacteroidetes bacterium GWA2_31_9]